MMKLLITSAAAMMLCLGGTAHAQSAANGDAAAATHKVSMCIGCHGLAGYKTAFPTVYSVPMIGGQSVQYVAKALQAYRADERSHPTMTAIAKSLSDKDIEDLAAYYGRGK